MNDAVRFPAGRCSIHAHMLVQVHRTIAEMNALRAQWDSVFSADPHASVFLSWPWMRAWMEIAPDPLIILSARVATASPCIAFLPLACRGADSRIRIDHVRELAMAGDPLADYTGFLISPGYESAALHALSRTIINDLDWDRLCFKDLADPRLGLLLPLLVQHDPQASNDSGQCCPFIPLPASWDAYLSQLSRAFRHSLRQKLKRALSSFSLTTLANADPQVQINAAISLALGRSREHPDPNLFRQRTILDRCVAENLAEILVLHYHHRPVAAAALLIDHKLASLGCILTGFDESFAQHSPGTVIMALAIRHAIEHGFKTFDFLRGDEPYKFRFAAQPRLLRNIRMARLGFGSSTRLAIDRLRRRLGA